MHPHFFPLNSEAEIVEREARLAQEFGIYDESMLVSRFIYLSDKVLAIWKVKQETIEKGATYIGG
jgi:hypothetical protein